MIFRILRNAFALIGVFVVFAIVGLYFIPLEKITQKALDDKFRQLNLPDATAEVKAAGKTGLEIQNFSLGKKANISFGKLSASFSPDTLKIKRVNDITISEAKISMGKDEKISWIGSKEFFASEIDPNAKSSQLVRDLLNGDSRSLPFDNLKIRNLAFDYSAPFGSAKLKCDTEISTTSGLGLKISIPDGKLDLNEMDIPNLGKLTIKSDIFAELPIKIKSKILYINGGIIKAKTPGTITLLPSEATLNSAETNPGMKILVDALQQYNFSSLEIKLDSIEGGKVNTHFMLKGSSPKVENGREININLNLGADILALIKGGMGIYE